MLMRHQRTVVSGKKRNGKILGGHLGDIVLAFETIAREAREAPSRSHIMSPTLPCMVPASRWLRSRTERDAVAMEHTERAILRRLAIPDPYRREIDTRRRTTTARAAIKKSW